MIDFYPQKRPLMADIIGHPWMQGECATPEEIAQEFAERQEMIKSPDVQDMAVKTSSEGATRRG